MISLWNGRSRDRFGISGQSAVSLPPRLMRCIAIGFVVAFGSPLDVSYLQMRAAIEVPARSAAMLPSLYIRLPGNLLRPSLPYSFLSAR